MTFQERVRELANQGAIPEFPIDTPAFGTERSAQEKRSWAQELLARKMEALALYRPSPFQEALHACKAKQCILRKGQQTGGSIALFSELSRAVTGQDPHDKYPKKNGVAVVLGMSMDHIGINIYPYLFQSARFKIIKDEVSNEWRVWRPWEESDLKRAKQALDAPPLIPERFVKGGYDGGIHYENRGQNIFSRVEFTNGWVLLAMGSQGVPKAGFQADLVCIDEDLEKPNWYQEMIARLLMRDGKLRWAALPYGHNDAIMNMIQLAESEENSPDPEVVCISATIYDNPYMPAKSRDATIKAWRQEGEDVYMMRAFGELTLSTLMYPSFNKTTHCIPRPEGTGTIYDLMMKLNGEPPPDWCRYMVVDPGHTVCAVLFIAVPPPHLGNHAVVYDELYIQECDAVKFGRLVAAKARDQQFEAFIIDMHGGRLRDIGGGEQPCVQYQRQLERHGVFSNRTGSGFLPGSPEVDSRQTKLREWLSVRDDNSAKLQILTGYCPNLIMNFAKYKRAKDKTTGVITDKPNTRTPNHAINCLEYAAANGLPYIAPRTNRQTATVYDEIMRTRSDMRKLSAAHGTHADKNFINLGPQGVS